MSAELKVVAANGRCPFCGSEDKPYSSSSMDHCHWVGKFSNDLKGIRSIWCYERQLTQHQELLREVVEVISTYRGLKKDFNSGGCACSDCQRLDAKAQALLQKLEKAMETGEK
jgi:hypothetical protein